MKRQSIADPLLQHLDALRDRTAGIVAESRAARARSAELRRWSADIQAGRVFDAYAGAVARASHRGESRPRPS
jgi:hypothetical protein